MGPRSGCEFWAKSLPAIEGRISPMWYRVFCRSGQEVKPADLLAHLQAAGLVVEGHFRGDDLGWTAAELVVRGGGTPVYVERYLTEQDDLRADLNTWAGYLETLDYSPNHGMLMEHVIQTRQLFTLRKPIDHANDAAVEAVCAAACQFLAGSVDGVYQIEGEGWYSPAADLLVKEY